MRAVQGISPHSKADRAWCPHFDTDKASLCWGKPRRQQLSDHPVRNVSACCWSQWWKRWRRHMWVPHICLPRGWTWACEGQGAFILLIFVISFFAGLTLPFTVVPKGRSFSCSALNLVSCSVFLSRSSISCPKKMKRALLFMSLPDLTFLWILCNLPKQELLVLWGLNLQHSVHQILLEGCFLPARDELSDILGNWASPSCMCRSGHGVVLQHHGALSYYSKLVTAVNCTTAKQEVPTEMCPLCLWWTWSKRAAHETSDPAEYIGLVASTISSSVWEVRRGSRGAPLPCCINNPSCGDCSTGWIFWKALFTARTPVQLLSGPVWVKFLTTEIQMNWNHSLVLRVQKFIISAIP